MKIEMLAVEEPAIAMAPLIDMTFLLLIFFMCASHISTQRHLPLEIPVADKGVVPLERPDRWMVNIPKEGGLYSGDEPIELATLAAQVKARLAEQPSLSVYIRADGQSRHRDVKKVMNALAEVGIDNFIFGVYKPGEPGGGGE